MLIPKIGQKRWTEILIKKLTNFCRKSPIMMSFLVMNHEGREGVMITHENSATKYFFPVDIEGDIKDFIAEIKRKLVENHYPRLIREEYRNRPLTMEEIAIKLESGDEPEKIQRVELEKTSEEIFVIDKILSWKDIAILKLESSTKCPEDVGKSFQYKYNGSIVLYLKKYRSGKHSMEVISNEFWSNATLIRCIEETKVNSNENEGSEEEG